MPGILLRWALFIPVSLVVRRRTFRVSASGFPLVAALPPLVLRIAWLACDKCGRSSRGGDHQRHPQSTKTALRLTQLARNKLLHARQLLLCRGVAGEKILGQADRAQRQAHRFLDAFPLRKRDLTTTAAHINQKTSALRAGFAHHPTMDQARLFQAGDDLHFPTGFGFHPGKKGLRIARVAQRRSGYRPHPVGAMHLDRSIETLQRHQGARHGFRRDHSALKNARSEPSYFTILMQHF